MTDTALRVDVRLFGRYRELAEGGRLAVELPASATVADLVAALHEEAPGRLPERPVVVVNRRPAADDLAIGVGDEIALIPPVAGG